MASLRIVKLTRRASASDCWAASSAGGAGLSAGRETSDMGGCLGKTGRLQKIRGSGIRITALSTSALRTSVIRAWQRAARMRVQWL